jgi:signal transduction histidine kinase
MVRAFVAIHRHSGWRSIFAYFGRQTHAVYRSLGHQRQWPRKIFLGWCGVSFLTWNWAVFELRMQWLIGPGGPPAFGLLLWLPLMVAVAWPVAVLWERRVEGRHRREIAVLQRKKQETNLKLLVLQAQIEPHFLFNTLASLRALLREDAARAEEMVDALVRHLRAVLPMMRLDSATSTLSDQLAICASYLEIMANRTEGRLEYRIDVPRPLLQTAFPPLMLLTLVENAVKHGIEPKVGAGRICIEAERIMCAIGFAVAVRVIDNGVGLSWSPGHGLGLKNVREQLALCYGDRASLSLASPPEGGTIACIEIPLNEFELI